MYNNRTQNSLVTGQSWDHTSFCFKGGAKVFCFPCRNDLTLPVIPIEAA
jgi:hypothetical protein